MSIAFYNGATGMKAFQSGLDVTSHNISNINTNGYKARRPAFNDLLRSRINTNVEGEHLVGHGVKQEYVEQMMGQNAIQETGYALDFAIVGEGFFSVDYRGQQLYTRNGAFDFSVDGNLATLVTNDGGYVLDRQGNRITLPFANGTVETDGLAERLGVYAFANPYGLIPDGNTRYRQSGNSGEPQLVQLAQGGQTGTSVSQFYLESSGVDYVNEVTEVISNQRAYQMNARVVQTADTLMELVNNMR